MQPIMKIVSLLVVLLLTTDSLVESHDTNCTVTCDEQRCKDISDEMTRINSNEVLCIMTGHYSLNKTVILYNINNVSIIATDGMANILCNTTVGMAIIDVQQFWMENITFSECALTGELWDQKVIPVIKQLLNFTNIYSIPSEVGKSLTIAASRDISLCHVNVLNSKGVGLLVLNVIGQFFLQYCTFDGIVDNNCPKSSDELHCISGAAMFYLSDNKIPLSGDNSILIDNCTFKNSISHSNYVALELSDGIFKLDESLGNNQSVYPLDGSAGLSVIMDRHYAPNSRQYFIVRNSW